MFDLNGNCTHSHSFYPIIISQQLQLSTHRGWRLPGLAVGGWDGCAIFRTPAREGPTQQSHPVLFALEQWGEMFEASFPSTVSLALCFAPLIM